jgi:hypothetical protein
MKYSSHENEGLYGFIAKRFPRSIIRPGEQFHIAERSIQCPPAAFIEDKYGNTFTLGYSCAEKRNSVTDRFCFSVLRADNLGNVHNTGEFAAFIEMDKNGVVKIYGNYGKSSWKRWTGTSFI